MGLASDAMQPRLLMTAGAIVGAIAAFLFALSGSTSIFFLSRLLEGVGAAAIVPALLAFLTDSTDGRPALRVKVISYFELTLLAGLALGGIVAAQLFRALNAAAFTVVSVLYLACALILFSSISSRTVRHLPNPIDDLRQVLRLPSIRHLAPVWLCVNSVVGLWLGPTLPFLLTGRSTRHQYLAGIYASNPASVGWLLFGYSIVFGLGVTVWSFVLPHIRLQNAMKITLGAMLAVCAGFYLLNHSGDQSLTVRWSIGTVIALLIMMESGINPGRFGLAGRNTAGAIGTWRGDGHLFCASQRGSHHRLSIGRSPRGALLDGRASLWNCIGCSCGTDLFTLGSNLNSIKQERNA